MEITRRNVPELAATLRTAGIAPVMARVFAARGIASTAELDNDLAGLPPWQALKGIAAAAERLADERVEIGFRLESAALFLGGRRHVADPPLADHVLRATTLHERHRAEKP